MDDLISRGELMRAFADFVRRANNSDFAPAPRWNDAVQIAEQLPPAQPEPQWIPCSERLPDLIIEAYTDAEDFQEYDDGQYEPVGIYTCFESEDVLVSATRESRKGIFTANYYEWRYEDGREKGTAWRDNNTGDVDYSNVIAWMPLPKPPKGGDE